MGYEEARAVFNGMIDRRPAAVVRAASAGDVVAAVTFAREGGLDLAVRGGGHSVPGFGTVDDGIVIDLSGMRGVEVDAGDKTARAQGGATWGDFNDGDVSVRLGDHRRHHLDHRRRRTDAGRRDRLSHARVRPLPRQPRGGRRRDRRRPVQVHASERENDDLFWALRGGQRELRRRHLVRVPAPPGEGHLRRARCSTNFE